MALLQFSESTNNTGLYETFLEKTFTNSSDYSAYKFARDVNTALARFFFLALKASQKVQVDDTNHPDYPIIKINIVSGQQDYPFTNDGSTTPNQVWTIDRVEAKDSSGNWLPEPLKPYDEMEEESSISITRSGIPYRYHQTANGIFLEDVPNYSLSEGLKVFTKRSPSYFVGTDTTKKAGIPDFFDDYLWLRPSGMYCATHLPKLAETYLSLVEKIEKEDIPKYYFLRNQSQRKGMRPNIENNK